MIKFQFNKTALGELGKQLAMRTKALPTIKSKESALRSEVKKAKDRVAELQAQLDRTMAQYDYMVQLWGEFDRSLITVREVRFGAQKIAGVEIPVLEDIQYEEKPYNLFSAPLWLADGMRILKELARLGVESEFYRRKMELLERARKKTTQKVNLYEKVQIPGYQEAIRKIKRFLEDEENLSKSSQKIVKSRLETEAAL
ncbi:V-type ATP synthase subunit D [uncultured Rikenella sp.]|uniref:V-type ATP synthase subunit D n=1 Tax=uncultured Rikenella sp. TaxID=368003 RepID=UPI0025EB3A28|nr:V-type ATP synthase subunit D [uncultured Rikenella sp.]